MTPQVRPRISPPTLRRPVTSGKKVDRNCLACKVSGPQSQHLLFPVLPNLAMGSFLRFVRSFDISLGTTCDCTQIRMDLSTGLVDPPNLLGIHNSLLVQRIFHRRGQIGHETLRENMLTLHRSKGDVVRSQVPLVHGICFKVLRRQLGKRIVIEGPLSTLSPTPMSLL